MRRQRFYRSRPLLIVPLTLLVFSARLIWTQETPSASKTPTQLSSLAEQFAAVPEANLRFPAACKNLSPPFALNQGPALPQMRMRSLDISSQLALTANNPLPRLWQPAKIDEPPVKANQFIGHAPPEWFTNAVPHHCGALSYARSGQRPAVLRPPHPIGWPDHARRW